MFISSRWPLVLFVLGALLRLLWLGDIPGGLNQDEASIGYDAWALVHAGIDRNGMSWPVNFIAWGSGQNVLYGYLSMPFIAILGLSVFSIRLTSAFWGVVCLWIFWRLGARNNKDMGLWALLLIVTSPWQMMASRWALESNILPAAVLVAVYCLVRAPENLRRRLPAATALLTLSVYAYGTAYLFAPLFLLCALVLIHQQASISLKTYALSTLSAFAVALPMILFILNNALGHGDLHLGPITIPHYPSEARYSNIFLPFAQGGLARIPNNMITVVQMLFGGHDDGLPWNAIPFWGPQFLFLTPFVMIGIVISCLPGSSLTDRLMLAWFICALVTAFCTDANINRINLVWLPSLWLAAQGLNLLNIKPPVAKVAQASLLVCGIWFSLQYFTSWSAKITSSFFDGFGKAISRIVELAPSDAPITVTSHSNMSYISALFFSKTPADIYVKTAVIPDRKAPFQSVTSFGRFTIGLSFNNVDQRAYWVAQKSELGAFINPDYVIESFGDYAAVYRRPAEQASCLSPLSMANAVGNQDFSTATLNGEVNAPGQGFVMSGQFFPLGMGVHGDSQWQIHLNQPADELSIGVGISDKSSCSDGMIFKLKSQGKTLYNFGHIRHGDLRFARIPLKGATQLDFVTEAGLTNQCDHGNWVRPILIGCGAGKKP